MIRYILRRVLQAIPTLFIISFMIYGILLAAPGGPQARFAQNPRMTPQAIERFKARWGLDQPVYIQYCRWLGACNPNKSGVAAFTSDKGSINILPGFLGGGDNGIVHGDLGFSINTGTPVNAIIGERFPRTLVLAGSALVLWLLLALIAGVIAAVKRYSRFDNAVTIFCYVGYSFPTFWLGILLIIT